MKFDIEYNGTWFNENADSFDEWFDADKFNWGSCNLLAIYCIDHFDKWWDTDKYDWEFWDYILAQCCSDHFEKWWDADKFDWVYKRRLVDHCMKYIDIWYDSCKFQNSKQMLKLLAL